MDLPLWSDTKSDECERKSKYTEKNLNLTTKIALLYRNLYQIKQKNQSQKNLDCESVYLNFTKFLEKKSEWFG